MLKFQSPVPIFRSFNERVTKEFYINFLGFEVVFEHRFEPDLPLYLGVRHGDCVLHLSEHHGDSTPGSSIRVDVPDVHAYCRILNEQHYRHARPGVQSQSWGYDDMSIGDPSGNTLIFCTPRP